MIKKGRQIGLLFLYMRILSIEIFKNENLKYNIII